MRTRKQVTPEQRALLEQNPHTRKKSKGEGRPWSHDGRSVLVPDHGIRARTSGHVAGGTMFGGG